MGQSITNYLKDKDKDLVEHMEILQEMSNVLLQAQSNKMKMKVLKDKKLPVVTILDTVMRWKVDVKDVSTDEIKKETAEIVRGNVFTGFNEEIKDTLTAFLDSTAESSQEHCHLLFGNQSLLRLDVYYYKYEFKSETMKTHGRNMFCYTAQVGLLDCINVDPRNIFYEITKYIDPEHMNAARKQLEKQQRLAQLFSFWLRDNEKLSVLSKKVVELFDDQTINTRRVPYVLLDFESASAMFYYHDKKEEADEDV